MSRKPVFYKPRRAVAGGLLALLATATPAEDLNPSLGRHLALAEDGSARPVSGQVMRSPRAVDLLYAQRAMQPLWLTGRPDFEALNTLLSWLDTAAQHGLQPDDYHLRVLQGMLASRSGLDTRRDDLALELLASDAALLFASHLAHGKLDRRSGAAVWELATADAPELATGLSRAVERGRLGEFFNGLQPADGRYRALQRALDVLRLEPGSGPAARLPAGRRLERGASGSRVALLRARLGLPDDSDLFDAGVETAVRQFQREHGLEPDGVVGHATRAVMNRGPEDVEATLLANLERWRWLPRALGRRRIEVNIPSFRLYAWDQGRTLLDMKVIVGKEQRSTPIFSGLLRYVVVNPYWQVPYKLAVTDLLPRFQARPELVQSLGFDVMRRNGAGAEELVPAGQIDWNALSTAHFPYRLRQRPGPRNALGRVKFLFPNEYAIYLHDTSDGGLFDYAVRTFSAGCIRVEQPRTLFDWLTEGRIRWPGEAGEPRWLTLEAPVPVHIMYFTAEPDASGQRLRLWPDVYVRDGVLARALREPPPGLGENLQAER